MSRFLQRIIRAPIHPVATILFPILALAADNRTEILLSDTYRMFALALVFSGIAVVLIDRYSRRPQRWLLTLSLLFIIFSSYGHVYNLARGISIGSITIGRHRFLIIASALLLALVTTGIFSNRIEPSTLTASFNLMSLVLLAFPFVTLLRYQVIFWRIETTNQEKQELQLDFAQPGQPPDVYYIILDSYAREDILRDIYGFDNHNFIEDLGETGFYVATNSNANHSSTSFSLASSLNLNYIQALDVDLPPGSYPRALIETIRNNLVMRAFKDLGYTTIATASGTLPTSMTNADLFLTPEIENTQADVLSFLTQINSFEEQYLYTTILRAPLDLLRQETQTGLVKWIEDAGGAARQRTLVLSAFKHLEQIPSIRGPKFVFTHIISPHRPYVFSATGEVVHQSEAFSLEDTSPAESSENEFELYKDQLLFINQKTLEATQSILEQSDVEPIIIIQADHGPAFGFIWHSPDQTNLKSKFPILNAYYLPDRCTRMLYPTISPVNTFRVVFNCLYQTDLELLGDKSYFTDHHNESGYDFIPVEKLLITYMND